MSERRLSQVLTRRFSRVAWTALAGYALVVVLLFAVAAEMALRRSLEHSADFIQSLLGAYRDSTSAPGGVMPSALADQLVGMGGQVVITRTTTNAGGMPQVYYLSPGMPPRRLEGLPDTSPEQARAARAAILHCARKSRAPHAPDAPSRAGAVGFRGRPDRGRDPRCPRRDGARTRPHDETRRGAAPHRPRGESSARPGSWPV